MKNELIFLIIFSITAILLADKSLSQYETTGSLTDKFVYEFTFTDKTYPTDPNYQIGIEYRKSNAQKWEICKILKINDFEEWRKKEKKITGQVKVSDCIKELGTYQFRIVGSKEDLKNEKRKLDFESNYISLTFTEGEPVGLVIVPTTGKLSDSFKFIVTFDPAIDDKDYEILFQSRKVEGTIIPTTSTTTTTQPTTTTSTTSTSTTTTTSQRPPPPIPGGQAVAIPPRTGTDTEWKDFGNKQKLSEFGNSPFNTVAKEIVPSSADNILTTDTYEFRVIAGKPLDKNSPKLTSGPVTVRFTTVSQPITLKCGSQCGSTTCKSYEICAEISNEFGKSFVCDISVDCGATCSDVVNKYKTTYPDLYKIKEKPCNNYDNCFDTNKDGFGKSYACSSGFLCNGKCDEKGAIPKTCSDGTEHGKCSSNIPKYCDNGNLVDKSECCPVGQKLEGNTCKTTSSFTCKFKQNCEITVAETAVGYAKLIHPQKGLLARSPCEDNKCILPGSLMTPPGATYDVIIEWIGGNVKKTITITG